MTSHRVSVRRTKSVAHQYLRQHVQAWKLLSVLQPIVVYLTMELLEIDDEGKLLDPKVLVLLDQDR
ncbi:hypothetical protein RP20_CCG002396 [Aedes albopictus]|nr:hypothetical protein RP20_CCG002396 [Aedes albopictus]